jgi:hypothetical protein
MRASQAKNKRKKGVVVDLGTTLEERFPKDETLRIMTPDECLEFCRRFVDFKTLREGIQRRLINARTLVLMAACAYIPADGTETTRQAFLSLEKSVREYRAAVMIDERSRKTKVT